MRELSDDEAALDAYQHALTEWLAAPDLDPVERTRRLREDPRVAPFAAYVASIDPRCVEVFNMLMMRWSARR
jgi:hypothetical protein